MILRARPSPTGTSFWPGTPLRRLPWLFLACLVAAPAREQTIEELTRDLPPHVSVLTSWGVRPEWDETGENIYFLHRLVGDVFRVHVATRTISPVTSHLHHGGIQRVQCLANGDLLLGIGNINTGDIARDKEKLDLFVLRKSDPSRLHALGAVCVEGPAVSKRSLLIAWTLPGQLEMRTGRIEYVDGVPRLVEVKTVLNYRQRPENVRLETQDFRPPDDRELLFTHYHGPAGDPYVNAAVHGLELATGKITDYTRTTESYNEVEGVFPDGAYTMIESDRHLPPEWKKRYKVDIFRLKLDGSGEVEQLADLAQRFPATLRSDNPVVDRTGRYVAYQFGFSRGAGARGQGIFLLDLARRPSVGAPTSLR
jgi:hypothetical protein